VFPPRLPLVRAVTDPGASTGTAGYIVGAMMTASHAPLGERLSASCRAHSLPLAIFELPAVHRSISPQGSDDLSCTKASFINFMLERYDRPVLYLDVDCVVARRPWRFDELLAEKTDFAIFNWLAEEHTEAYVRTDMAVQDGSSSRVIHDRYYRFSHSIDWMSETQLLCSGAVQWYNNTAGAMRLLERWQDVVARSAASADDKCLDFAFNNLPADAPKLKTAWLQKRYARYAWWIYERPCIDHPEFPSRGEGFVPLDDLDGQHRIHMDALRQAPVNYTFPKDCLIDTEARTLLRLRDGKWRAAERFSTALWL
jgi:hypothetical protein